MKLNYAEEELIRSQSRGFRMLAIAAAACFTLGFLLGFVAGRA